MLKKFCVSSQNMWKKNTEKNFIKIFGNYDIIILPTIQKPAKLSINYECLNEYFEAAFYNVKLTCPFNLLGFPALSLDFYKNEKDKTFCPLMIVSKHFAYHRVLQFAKYIQNLI